MRIAKTRKVVKIVQLDLFYTQLTKSTEKNDAERISHIQRV